MTEVHPDWHLASWAQGAAGRALLPMLLADQRLQPRLERVAARGRGLARLAEVADETRCVLQWFNQEPPARIFHCLGTLCHAAAWGESLVRNRGKGVPEFIALEEVKRGLAVLQDLPDAALLRLARKAVDPEGLVADGRGLVCGWWQSLGPELAESLALACPMELSVDLPTPPASAELCGRAVVALALCFAAEPAAEASDPDLVDEVDAGGFDD